MVFSWKGRGCCCCVVRCGKGVLSGKYNCYNATTLVNTSTWPDLHELCSKAERLHRRKQMLAGPPAHDWHTTDYEPFRPSPGKKCMQQGQVKITNRALQASKLRENRQ